MTEQELLEVIHKAVRKGAISLDLSYNRLSRLPPEIGQLVRLQSLNLGFNQLSQLPPEIGQLTNLQSLDLRSNQLSQLPPEIGQLVRLQSLNLSDNQLSQLPPEIDQLTNLQSLDLRFNQLSQLPPEIQKYLNAPKEAAKQIPRYYRQVLEQETDRLYEAKLLIVGEGGAGKTSLAKKVEDENYPLDSAEQSTEGIDIIQWEFPFKEDKAFRVNSQYLGFWRAGNLPCHPSIFPDQTLPLYLGGR